MTIPAWQVISWKPVLTTWPEFRGMLARMRPMDPMPRRGGRLRQGQTLWAATHQGLPLGLAWDWAEVRDESVALSDPMNVLSNVRLVDDDGVPLAGSQRIVHLNSAVHELDWQVHVRRPRLGLVQPAAA